MSALAYLYDHQSDLPEWVRGLTKRQLEDIADLMVKSQLSSENLAMLPMEEIERREVLRALVLCGGSISKTAKMLKMGKTTIHRKLRRWGYSARNQILLEQASAISTKDQADEKLL